MTTLYPTHRCFDDALELLEAEAKLRNPHVFGMVLAHGILLFPEDSETPGMPYAHAWVESGSVVVQAAILDGERIYYGVEWADFAAHLRPQQVTRYTIEQAVDENHRHGHYGPWLEEYRALLRPRAEPHEPSRHPPR